MSDSFIYLFLNIASVSVPFLASFYPKYPFYKKFRAFLWANLPVSAFFILWDMYFTKIGIWGFNNTYLSGIYMGNLPLEEVLFFICIPFACTFTFFSLSYFFKNLKSTPLLFKLTGIVGAALLIIGLYHHQKWYTFSAFTLTGMLLIYIAWKKNWTNWALFLLGYTLCLIPFYLVNGVLTGSGIAEQVVWYNDAENLGIRIFTIPIEDHVYSLLLQGLNVLLYDKVFVKRYSLD